MTEIDTPFTFGLVHGAFHSADCWTEVIPELRKQGHAAVAMDLPIENPDKTFDDYADVVVDTLEAYDNIVAVGWSRGGNVIPRIAGKLTLKGMIFLCASLDYATMQRPTTEEAQTMPPRNSDLYLDALTQEGNNLYAIDPEAARDLFYHDCSDQTVVEKALNSLRLQRRSDDEPILRRWPDVPQAYILGANDQVVNPEWSRYVCRNWLGIVPREIPSGHAPNYACPELLAAVLVDTAKNLGKTA